MIMECRIESKEYFKKYAKEKVFGLTPAEHLERKLLAAGYKILEGAKKVFYDDMFYLDVYILRKGPVSATQMLEEMHSGLQFHNAVLSIKREINTHHINNGVMLVSINDTYIDMDVEIGEGTVIYPNCFITGETKIGKNCVIGPDSMIDSSKIGDGCEIIKSVVKGSEIGKSCKIGPYSHIRPDNVIGERVKIGAYAEVKKSEIGDKTTIPHLAYVGDSKVGRNCNISCGVITANYDGKVKSVTDIGDNCFVGCNSTLIAPVKVGKDSYIAAGSTITDDVGELDLAIARSRQINKGKWVEKTMRKRKEKE